MSLYKRILVPVDGSATSNRGLREAVRLAKNQKAQLWLVHVVEEYFVTQVGEGIAYSQEMFDSMRAGGRRVLARVEASVRKSGVKVHSVMLESVATRVSDLVVRQARKVKADLIVIGTHGRRGITRAVMGSDAEAVVRESPVPVLLVRSRR